jgi:hypothetical protein
MTKFRFADWGDRLRSQPIEIDLDPKAFEVVAKAMLAAIADGIKHISVPAAASTIAKRRRKGITSTTLFNASGELAAALRLVASAAGEWAIAAPADRFSVTFRLGAADRALARLHELVIALRDPLSIRSVSEAIERAVDSMVTRPRR